TGARPRRNPTATPPRGHPPIATGEAWPRVPVRGRRWICHATTSAGPTAPTLKTAAISYPHGRYRAAAGRVLRQPWPARPGTVQAPGVPLRTRLSPRPGRAVGGARSPVDGPARGKHQRLQATAYGTDLVGVQGILVVALG